MDKINTCIRVFADPTQIRNCKETTTKLDDELPCDLSDVLGMTVGGISQHLRRLKDGGIIKDRKIGQTVFYSLIAENLKIVKLVLESLSKQNQKELMS